MQQFHAEIEQFLEKAVIITRIPDIWEKNNDHRLGLAAIVTFDSFERRILIISIEIIDGSSAERVKQVTESIVNTYEFDKSKIKGSIT